MFLCFVFSVLKTVCVSFYFLYAFFNLFWFLCGVGEGGYMNEHFHMLPSIALRDFVTLQVQTFVVVTQALTELTKYRYALLFVKKKKKKKFVVVFFLCLEIIFL